MATWEKNERVSGFHSWLDERWYGLVWPQVDGSGWSWNIIDTGRAPAAPATASRSAAHTTERQPRQTPRAGGAKLGMTPPGDPAAGEARRRYGAYGRVARAALSGIRTVR